MTKRNRGEQVIINKLRLGHTLITQGFLLDEGSLGHHSLCGWCEVDIIHCVGSVGCCNDSTSYYF